MSWQNCAAESGIDISRIENALASGQGEELLSRNLKQVSKSRVSTTPTLFINHKPYSGRIELAELIKHICQQLPVAESNTACAEIPECSSDQDCSKPDMIGSCESAGTKQAKCDFKSAVEFPLTIVHDAGNMISPAISNTPDPLEWIRQLFPGINTKYVTADSISGKSLIEEYHLNRLPAYLFGKAALKAKNIDQLKEELTFVKDQFVLSPALANAMLYINRTPEPGQISFLFSPLSPKSNLVLQNIYDIIMREHPTLGFQVRYLIKRNSPESFAAVGGLAELEEIRRQLIIQRDHAEKFKAYIKLRGKNPASSYWEQPLLELGLDPGQIKQKAQSKAADKLLAKEADYLEGLELSPAPLFLVNNQELVLLQNSQQFKELLHQLRTRETQRAP